jgi:hypothetical protein
MTCRQLLIKDKLLMLNVYPLRRDRVTNHKFLVSWQAGRQAGRAQQDQVQELLSHLQEDFLSTTMPSSSTCYLHSH